MKQRKRTTEEKLSIIMEDLKEKKSIADICREHQISQTLYYRWHDKFLEGGKKALTNGSSDDDACKAEIERLQKIISKQVILLLIFMLSFILSFCSGRLPKDKISEAIVKALEGTHVPVEWLGPEPGMPDWGLARISNVELVDILEIEKFNEKGKFYPVKARVKAVVGVNALLYGHYTKSFDRIMWFDVCSYKNSIGRARKGTEWFASLNFERTGIRADVPPILVPEVPDYIPKIPVPN